MTSPFFVVVKNEGILTQIYNGNLCFLQTIWHECYRFLTLPADRVRLIDRRPAETPRRELLKYRDFNLTKEKLLCLPPIDHFPLSLLQGTGVSWL